MNRWTVASVVATAVAVLATRVTAEAPREFFDFSIPFNDTTSGTANDVSFLNDKPAGANGYVIAKDGHFVEERTGKRIRFFGTNLGAENCFPTRADAEMFAKRLAKAGINVVRLHHMDNPWAVESGGSLWGRGSKNHLQIDARQLDKLDYLVSQLKNNGIYVNINLKVSKTLTPADGFDASIAKIKFPFQKRIDFFDDRMIALQKGYAKQLLAHVNPYTKLSYADDPAVAFVEINNENSLLGYWTRTLGAGLDELPDPFKAELRAKWNAWLKKHYASDDALRDWWNKGATPLGPSLITQATEWGPENQGESKVQLTPQETSAGAKTAKNILIDVQKTDGTDWHVQASLRGLDLKDGDTYTVSFRVRSESAKHPITVNVALDKADWRTIGLSKPIEATPQWKQQTLTFKAVNTVPNHARLAFVLGGATGKVWLSDVVLHAGAEGMGLQKDESLAKANVAIPASASSAQSDDWLSFLIDTERDYAAQMRHVLKDELKVHANVTLTQIDYGGIAGMSRERDMEYADGHAYWQHPEFPGTDWDQKNWKIKNTSEVSILGAGSFGVLGDLAAVRVAGKPFSVSEFDHPAPSDYVCEMMPTYATFAAFQDWDVIYTFATASYGSNEKPDHITGFFDQNNHPAKWGMYPTAALIFRRGLIPVAQQTATLHLAAPPHAGVLFADDGWKKALGEDGLKFLAQKLSVSDRPLDPDTKPQAGVEGESGKLPIEVRTTGVGQVYVAQGDSAAAIVGYVADGKSIDAGALHLTVNPFGNGFAAVTAVARDGKPFESSGRVLVTVCGRVENTDMQFNADRTSVGTNWGRGPTRFEKVPARISIKCTSNAKVFALDGSGNRAGEVPSKYAGGILTFDVTRSPRSSMWYEISSDAK